MQTKFYSSHWFLKNQIFSLFMIVNMNANYAEICRVSNLEADFQQVPLVHFFLKSSQCYCETPIIKLQQRKIKKYFLKQKNPKNNLTIEIA